MTHENVMTVRSDNCTGCSLCTLSCSMINQGAFNPADSYISVKRDLKKGPQERYSVEFTKACTKCGFCLPYCNYEAIGGVYEVPCLHGCPAAVDMPRYFRKLSVGDYQGALEIIRETNPFPMVTGRVCSHPCETHCWTNRWGQAISIRALERLVADKASEKVLQENHASKTSGQQVAVVGSGPAGLTAAYYLAKYAGCRVTVFEARPEAGGLMRYGIPAFKLPRKVLDQEIKAITRLGVDIKVNCPVDKTEQLLEQGFQAVLVATGAPESTNISLPGRELGGVITSSGFLHDVNSGRKVKLGRKVIVLGGGSSAVDAARCALRLRCDEVQMLSPEPWGQLTAYPRELKEAEKEGVIIRPGRTPVKILDQGGRVSGVECLETKSLRYDNNGVQQIETVEDSHHTLECDTLILALNPAEGLPLAEKDKSVKSGAKGAMTTVETDTRTAGKPGIFTCGELVNGSLIQVWEWRQNTSEGRPRRVRQFRMPSIAEAIGAGRRATIEISKYLGGTGEFGQHVDSLSEMEPGGEGEQRPVLPCLSIADREKNFAEVELGLTVDMALAEVKRCLGCTERIFRTENS